MLYSADQIFSAQQVVVVLSFFSFGPEFNDQIIVVSVSSNTTWRFVTWLSVLFDATADVTETVSEQVWCRNKEEEMKRLREED